MKIKLIYLFACSTLFITSCTSLEKMKDDIVSVANPELAKEKEAEAKKAKLKKEEQKQQQQVLLQKRIEAKKRKDVERDAKKRKEIKERQVFLEKLKASRSGKVAFSPLGIQWGDSLDVLKEICAIHFDEYNFWYGKDGIGRLKIVENNQERKVILWIDSSWSIGIFSIEILFPAKGDVIFHDIVEKYTKKYGAPKKSSRSLGSVHIYTWNTKKEIVEVSATFHVLTQVSETRVFLTEPSLKKKLLNKQIEQNKKAATEALKAKDIPKKVLNF